MGTDSLVKIVINLWSCRTELPLRREWNKPAQFPGGDWTSISRKIILYIVLKYSLNETVDESVSKHVTIKNEKENSSEFKKTEYLYYYFKVKQTTKIR